MISPCATVSPHVAPSTFLPTSPSSLLTLSSTSPLLLLHSTNLSLQPRLLLSAPLNSPLPFLSLSLSFRLHTFLFSLRTFTPSSFPSTSTPLLSLLFPLLLPQPQTLLHSFSFTPTRALPTYASLLLSTFSPTSLLPPSFLPLSRSYTSFRLALFPTASLLLPFSTLRKQTSFSLLQTFKSQLL